MPKQFAYNFFAVCACLLLSLSATAKNTHTPQHKDSVVRTFTAFGGNDNDDDSGWRAVIKRQHMTLELTKNHEYHRKIYIKRTAYAKGVEFTGRTAKGEVVINIRSTPCKDRQGNDNEFTATLYYQGKAIKGCAVRGAYPKAPT